MSLFLTVDEMAISPAKYPFPKWITSASITVIATIVTAVAAILFLRKRK